MAFTRDYVTVSNILATIRSRATAAGWTEPTTGTFVSPGQTTVRFTVGAVTSTQVVITTETVSTVTRTFALNPNSNSTAGFVTLRCYFGSDYVHLNVSSPLPGESFYNAAQTRSSFTITTISPYSSGVAFDATRHVIAIGSTGVATQSDATAYVRNPDSGGWEGCRLMTIKSAIQATTIADQPLYQPTVKTYWPYLAIGATRGLIGAVQNVYFASESYQDSEDNWSAENVRTAIAGSTYRAEIPLRTDSNTSYSPFGNVGVAQGGPYILVKE